MAGTKKIIPIRERVISGVLLAMLVVVVFGVVGHGFLFSDTGRHERTEVVYSLPAGWTLAGKWEIYPKGRLYEKIDGREPLFTQYGVKRLAYASVTSLAKDFEIYAYTMSDPDGTLGIYLANMPAKFDEVALGSMADVSGGELRAFQGETYVEILSMEKEADQKLLISLATEILKSSSGQSKASKGVFEVLPADGRLRGSLSLNRENTFGLTTLTNTFSASYTTADGTFDLFVRRLDSNETGESILKKIQAEVTDYDGKVTESTTDRLSADFMDKALFLAREEKWLVGFYGELTKSQAQLQLDAMRNRLKARNDGRK